LGRKIELCLAEEGKRLSTLSYSTFPLYKLKSFQNYFKSQSQWSQRDLLKATGQGFSESKIQIPILSCLFFVLFYADLQFKQILLTVLFSLQSQHAVIESTAGHQETLNCKCLKNEATPTSTPNTAPILQSCLSLLIPMVSWCMLAVSLLYFGQFNPFHYSPLPLPSHRPPLCTKNTS
jgi:hypothetical protein